ncbi:OsmC family protein [Magnetospira thiophila]
MTTTVTWTGGMTFNGVSASGHELVIDGKRVEGPSPMELLLLGAGGCSSIDVVMILEKMREQVSGVECRLEAERADSDPKVYTQIDMHFIVTGKGLSPDKVDRAVHLSAEKYCSASIMLAKTATITHSFEIIEG